MVCTEPVHDDVTLDRETADAVSVPLQSVPAVGAEETVVPFADPQFTGQTAVSEGVLYGPTMMLPKAGALVGPGKVVKLALLLFRNLLESVRVVVVM